MEFSAYSISRMAADDNFSELSSVMLSISELERIDAGLEPALRELTEYPHLYTASMAKVALFALLYRAGRDEEAARMMERELARLRLLSRQLRKATGSRSPFDLRYDPEEYKLKQQRSACQETLERMLEALDMGWGSSDPIVRAVEKAMAFSRHGWVQFQAIRLVQVTGIATPRMRRWLEQMRSGEMSRFISPSDISAAWHSIGESRALTLINAD